MSRSALLLVLCVAASGSHVPSAAAQPNVLVIITDDMGWGDAGYNGSEIRTPELDRLAASGVRFDRYYSHAVCTPTRAALMTGRRPLRTGVYGPSNPWHSKGLSNDEKLLPEYFREAGYRTHAVGKWHMGPNEPAYHPQNRGFDTFYGHLHGMLNYRLHTLFGRLDWQRNGKTLDEEGYSTRLIGNEAVRLIREHDDEVPFFLYVAFNAPHQPLQAPEETIAEYTEIQGSNRRTYAAMVTEVDRAVGRITAALDEERLTDNTLVLFISDNGGAPHLGASNVPLRGGKGQAWEGGLRVPGFMSWPAVFEPGTVYPDQITTLDLLPTLASAAGIELAMPKPIDGRDMWASLSRGDPAPEGPVLLSHFAFGFMQHAYFKDEWKLVLTPNEDGQPQF